MSKRYFIEVSRNDIGLVSYFPVLEVMKEPDGFWIEEVLLPSIESIARRKDKTIRSVPITFWMTVRKTARHKAEAFVFTTPAYPGIGLEKALRQSLESIPGGNVHAAREAIPENAVPFFQLFRNKIIRFYVELDGHEGFYLPIIKRGAGFPEWGLFPIPRDNDFVNMDCEIEDTERFLARAEISSVTDGKYCRNFQQELNTIARRDK